MDARIINQLVSLRSAKTRHTKSSKREFAAFGQFSKWNSVRTNVLSADVASMSIAQFSRTETLKQFLHGAVELVETSTTLPDNSEIAAKFLAKIQVMKAGRSSE